MRELHWCRRLERGDRTALRIDTAEYLADRPILAGGVESLEDEEDAPLPLGIETLLKRRKIFEEPGEFSSGLRLALQVERVARVPPPEVCGGPRMDDERTEHRSRLLRATASRSEPSLVLPERRGEDDKPLRPADVCAVPLSG